MMKPISGPRGRPVKPFLLRLALLIPFSAGLAIGARLLATPEPVHGTPGPVAAATPGRILFGKGGQIWELANGQLQPVTVEGGWRQAKSSPDGSHIAAVGTYPSASDIFVLAADGETQRQLTRNRRTPSQGSDWAFHPRWAPDGLSIAFVTDRASFYPMLWRMNADGSGLRQLTFPSHGLDAMDSFSWSPDGRSIAATRFLSSKSQIFLIDLARSGPPRALTSPEEGAFDPAWSPDGQFLAYVARQGEHATILVVNLDEPGRATAVAETELARSPEWSPAGNRLAYIGLAGGNFEIFSIDVSPVGQEIVAVGRPSQLTVQFGVDPLSGLSWTP